MRKPEILAPAGNLEKLKIAVDYGADAVYIGGGRLNLRAFSNNFTTEQIIEGIKYCHDRGRKLYVTLNVFPRNHDLEGAESYIRELYEIGVDAVIVADPSLVAICKEVAPELEIHLSTQANTVNYEACNMWHKMGAERVVLGRECSLKDIIEVRENIPEDLELEVFVHGAMCISYSGRCLLSSYMAGRDSNRGACAQSCRWKYSLVEEKRPNEYFPIEEDQYGTYIMNSKDLCMIEHIPELMKAGISSLKIEGRNKSEYYVAIVVNAYRKAIDLYFEDPENYKLPKYLLDEMYKVAHRRYHTGFFFNEPMEEGLIFDTNNHVREYDVVALVLDYDKETGLATCRQRNKFVKGDIVEILSPEITGESFTVDVLFNEAGEEIDGCPHPGMICKVKVPFELEKNSFIRKALV